MPIETKKRSYCDWPGCGVEVMPYGDDAKIKIVVLGVVIAIEGVLCPDHATEILKNGKVINPFILKKDVDQAIADGLIVI